MKNNENILRWEETFFAGGLNKSSWQNRCLLRARTKNSWQSFEFANVQEKLWVK
jgi:hypothetical protein